MLARSFALILLAGICCAGAAEPKARPRLPPPVQGEVKRAAVQPGLEDGSVPRFRSFDDFLQAEARRPVGLEVVPEVAAARTETKGPAARDPSPTPPRMEAIGGEVLVLPKLEITAEKLTKLEQQLAALEANQSWETSAAEAWDKRTVVDAILNPPCLKLGDYSGSGRAALARRRVDLLHWVRVLSISLEEAKTPADKARIQTDIDGIKEIMRYWE